MCKAKAQGGQRCISHATTRLGKAQSTQAAVEAAAARGEATPAQVATARAANWKALVEYASTNDGAKTLRDQLATLPNQQDQAAQLLQGAINDGALLAQANRRAEDAFRASQGKGPLTTALPLTIQQQEALEATAREQAEAQAVAAQDPLGLRRQAQQSRRGLPTQAGRTIPATAPAMPAPTAPDVQGGVAVATAPAPAPARRAGLPTQPPKGLPTRPPQTAAAPTASKPVPKVAPKATRTRPAKAAPAAPAGPPLPTERERKAAAAQADRQARAEAARIAKEQRAAEVQRTKTVASESRRLTAEVAAEVKGLRKWAAETGTKKFTAPASTWAGPDRWSTGRRPTFAQNREAARAGRARYGAAFVQARQRFAGEYSAAEVLAACEALETQGRDRFSGRVRPAGRYTGYTTVDDQRINEARAEQYAKAFGPQDTDVMARQYVAANLEGVMWRARANRPPQSRSAMIAERSKRYLIRRALRNDG
jgi:hypothetical protein